MRNFIGVDLGGTNIRAAIVSEDGTIKCMKKSESHPERGAEAVMETMISLIESLDGYEECEGIGMGIPGPIDTINGKIIVSTNLPKLIGFPIAEYIENHFHKPTYMDNDVKVAALGEAVQGAGKDYLSFTSNNFNRSRRSTCNRSKGNRRSERTRRRDRKYLY